MSDESSKKSSPDLEQASSAVSQFAHLVKEAGDSQTRESVLRAEAFSIYYGDFQAVKSVSVDIPKGMVTAIIGPSGCGKSTLLNAVNRMTDTISGCRTEGALMYDGENLYDPAIDVIALRRKIGMVFQKPNPFPRSIYENVAYGPRIHGIRSKNELKDLVEKSLKEAGLWEEVKDRLRHNALALSGGQQQRLCIARALAIQPDLLLLDEPTSALDPNSTARIEELIDDLRGNYTVMIVTHNMQQAARVSDYTMFLYEGELIEHNWTSDFFTNPKHDRTRRYIVGRFG